MCITPVIIGLKMSSRAEYEAFINGRDAAPLQKTFENRDIARTICQQLLSPNETYERSNANDDRTLVTLSEKLKQVYDAIFTYPYTSENYQKQIGEFIFSAKYKDKLIQITSALSPFADYTI